MAFFSRNRERSDDTPLPEPAATYAAHGVRFGAPLQPLQAAADLTCWVVPVGDLAAGLALWARVRDLHPVTGLWPVLVTANAEETMAVGLGEEPSAVAPVDADAWFDARSAEAFEQFLRGDPAPWEPPDPSQWSQRVAVMPDEPDRLLLVPAPAGWDVPGLLGWTGAVNHGVLGDVHTAVLQRWSERWAAELVVIGFDTLTLRVLRPPDTPDAALAVATEMALYCEDIVHQGVQTLDALVPMAASSAWWFWWD